MPRREIDTRWVATYFTAFALWQYLAIFTLAHMGKVFDFGLLALTLVATYALVTFAALIDRREDPAIDVRRRPPLDRERRRIEQFKSHMLHRHKVRWI